MIRFLILIAALMTGCKGQQGCTKSDVIFVEGASFANLSLEQCQQQCQLNTTCNYFTWNIQTRGCGNRPYQYSALLDAPLQYVGTPYTTGMIVNKTLVGKISRVASIGLCAQSCVADTSCKSWTWYSSMVLNTTNICIFNFEVPSVSLPVSFSSSQRASSAAIPAIYSGVQSCQEVNEQCTSLVQNSICCGSLLPFVKNCGTDQNGTSGIIQSPNYPNTYGNGAACIWNIFAPADTVININITNFDTELNDKLFVFVKSSNSCSNAKEASYSGTLGPSSLLIPDNKAAVYFYSDVNGSRSGFSLSWRAAPNKFSCGANISASFTRNCGIDVNGTSGSIQSPNYPASYGNNVACGWNITGPAGTFITLSITAFQTEATADRLYILYPQNCSSVVNKELSGSLNQQIVTIPQSHVALYFVSDSTVSYSGFNINWSAAMSCTSFISNVTGQSLVKSCGENLSAKYGIIQSPNYPSNYGNSIYCEWTISTPPGSNISLTVDAFSTEANYDRLFILDAATCAQVVPPISGAPPAVVSPRNILTGRSALTLIFYTDSTVVNSGFSLTYSTLNSNAISNCSASLNNIISQNLVKNCGDTRTTSDGSIQSPNYPNSYGNNNYCEWTISAPPGAIVSITISAFSTQASYDRLFLLDTATCSPVVPAISGTMAAPQTIVTGTNAVTLIFYTDGTVVGSGFNLTYSSFNTTWSANSCTSTVNNFYNSIGYSYVRFNKNCGNSLNASNGAIQSPNYPSSYNYYDNCEWTITAPPGTVINITIKSLSFYPSDYLFIIDPASCKTLVNPITSASYPQTTIATGTNPVSVFFTSIGYYRYPGFSLTYTSFKSNATSVDCPFLIKTVLGQNFVKNCGDNLTSATGTIQSPNYPDTYGNNHNCEWNITFPPGNHINITITAFSTEADFDKLLILDAVTCNRFVTPISGTPPSLVTPQTIIIRKSAAKVYFISDQSGVNTGFSLSYSNINASQGASNCTASISNITGQTFIKNCGGIMTASNGTIQSPNFPNSYGNDHNCEWTINSPPGSNITITISAFSTEANFDRVIILHSATCGQVVPPMSGPAPSAVVTPLTVATGKNAVTVFFTSDGSVVNSGFSMTWRV